MDSPVRDLPLREIFKLTFIGWVVGLSILAALPLLFGVVFELLHGRLINTVVKLILLPIIVILQALTLSGIVCLGVAVYRISRGSNASTTSARS